MEIILHMQIKLHVVCPQQRTSWTVSRMNEWNTLFMCITLLLVVLTVTKNCTDSAQAI